MYYPILIIIILYIIYIIVRNNNYEYFSCHHKKCFHVINCKQHKKDNSRKGCIYQFNSYTTTCPNDSPNFGEKCLHCPYKRPGIDPNDNPECCRNKCYQKQKKIGIPYYCKKDGICIQKMQGKNQNKYCGYYTLYNTPAKIYNTFQECRNDLNIYKDLDKDQCLNTNGAGWCTDYRGIGLCVPGTPVGPDDAARYFMCYPNQVTNKNSWTPGHYDPNMVLRNQLI